MSVNTCLIYRCLSSDSAVIRSWFIYELQKSTTIAFSMPSEFPGFFWKYIFDLATPIRTNEHEFMPPQGCDLAATGDMLYSSVTRKT